MVASIRAAVQKGAVGMFERLPLGVVTQEGDCFVGRCDELGTTSVGQTVAEAFANLRVATWQRLAAPEEPTGSTAAAE